MLAQLSVCLSLAAFPHYCMHPDVSCGNGKGLCIIGWICSQCMGFVAVTTCAESEMSASACTRSVPGCSVLLSTHCQSKD